VVVASVKKRDCARHCVTEIARVTTSGMRNRASFAYDADC
jgi:hypothetical protein